MELNAEQIKKALECCIKASKFRDCERMKCPALTGNGCIYFDDGEGDIFQNMIANALAIIKELTEDNEYLKTQLTATEARAESRKESYLEEVLELRINVEELTEENERLRANAKSATEILNFKFAYDAGKSDTTKKFAERAKEEFRLNTDNEGNINACYVPIIIDQIAKEMLGEK